MRTVPLRVSPLKPFIELLQRCEIGKAVAICFYESKTIFKRKSETEFEITFAEPYENKHAGLEIKELSKDEDIRRDYVAFLLRNSLKKDKRNAGEEHSDSE